VDTVVPVVSLGIVSALAYAAAAVVQRRVAARGSGGLLRTGAWWASVLFNLSGAALHVGALRHGPLITVQTLGVLTLVAAPLLSAAVSRTRMTSAQWTGTALTVAGVAGLLSVTGSAGASRMLRTPEVLGIIAATAVALGLAMVAAAVARRPVGRSLWYAAAAGVAFATASALAQTAALRLSGEDAAELPLWAAAVTLAVIAVLGTAGLMLSQQAFREGLDAPLATLTLVNPLFASLIGALVLGERGVSGPVGLLTALAAALVAGRGVLVLARSEADVRAREAATREPGAAMNPTAPGPVRRIRVGQALALRQFVEVHIERGHEPREQVLEVDRGQRLHLEDVPQHRETRELRGHQ
jgi:drug/metabolite transporter (DMT)-like permease